MCESCNIIMASCIMHSHKDGLNFSHGMRITNMQTRKNITDNDTVGTTLRCCRTVVIVTTPHSNHHDAISTTQPMDAHH